jgi:hypothetical protein
MKLCKEIEERLISGHCLSVVQQEHLDGCLFCDEFKSKVELARTGAGRLSALREPKQIEVQQLVHRLKQKKSPKRSILNPRWVACAMACGVLGVVFSLIQDKELEHEDPFLTLMDEVIQITEDGGNDLDVDDDVQVIEDMFEQPTNRG